MRNSWVSSKTWPNVYAIRVCIRIYTVAVSQIQFPSQIGSFTNVRKLRSLEKRVTLCCTKINRDLRKIVTFIWILWVHLSLFLCDRYVPWRFAYKFDFFYAYSHKKSFVFYRKMRDRFHYFWKPHKNRPKCIYNKKSVFK